MRDSALRIAVSCTNANVAGNRIIEELVGGREVGRKARSRGPALVVVALRSTLGLCRASCPLYHRVVWLLLLEVPLSALSLSYRSTAPSRVWVPTALNPCQHIPLFPLLEILSNTDQSSGLQYSLGL